MQNLSTARVLLVDDVPEESLPILKALGRFGIACAYFSGERVEELEGIIPLIGIRLAFVDMRLGTFGSTRQAVSKTVSVLDRLIAIGTSPLVIIAWTAHGEDIAEFRSMLREARPDLCPLMVYPMPKPFEDDGKSIDFARLEFALNKLPKTLWPLGVLWSWEQLSHEATTLCTQEIAKITSRRAAAAGGDGASWLRALADVIRLLMAVGAGEHRDTESIARALTDVLASIHLDRIENGPIAAMRGQVSAFCRHPLPVANLREKAILNSMLGIAPVESTDRILRPGSLFLPKVAKKKGFAPASISFANKNDLFRDILIPKTEPLKAQCQRECRVFFVETTPSCDFDYQNRFTARFVAGLMVPEALAENIKKHKESSKLLPLVFLPGQGDIIWRPVLSARFLYAVAVRSKFSRTHIVARLRTNVLSDVQAWLAAHWARPGSLSVQ